MELNGAFEELGSGFAEGDGVILMAVIVKRGFVLPNLIHKEQVGIDHGLMNIEGEARGFLSRLLSHAMEQLLKLPDTIRIGAHAGDEDDVMVGEGAAGALSGRTEELGHSKIERHERFPLTRKPLHDLSAELPRA